MAEKWFDKQKGRKKIVEKLKPAMKGRHICKNH